MLKKLSVLLLAFSVFLFFSCEELLSALVDGDGVVIIGGGSGSGNNPGADTGADTDSSESDTDNGNDSDSESDSGGEGGTNAEPDSEAEPGAQGEPEASGGDKENETEGGSEGGSGTDSGSGTGSEGSSDSGSSSDAGMGGNEQPETQQEEGDSLQGYYVRPASKGAISITPSVDSDIWYVFTNTLERKIDKPVWYLPSSASNLLSPRMYFSFGGTADTTPSGPVKVDSNIYAQFKGPIGYRAPAANNFIKTRTRKVDVVGGEDTFYDNKRLLTATCKLVRTVDTAFGPRTLVIYEENDMLSARDGIPTDEEYVKIADAFLKDGLDNDIFDKLTGIFGCDWGKWNASTHGGLIEKDDKITLLYCNLLNQGDPGGQYIGGYYTPLHYCIDERYSNKRMMVTLHAHMSGGKNIGEGLTTIAHEFQHLLHDQYLNAELFYWGLTNFAEDGSSMTEMFSSITETLTAQFISESCDVEVPGPFYVGYNRNPKGYYKISGNSDLTSDMVNYFTRQGRAPIFLTYMDITDVMQWSNDLDNYAVVASLGAYLLINYGTEIFSEYIKGRRADILGIVDAINKVYPDANMTISKLIADWGTAVMLSKVPNLDSPVAFNKEGWYMRKDMKVPSINFYNYFNRTWTESSYTVFNYDYYGVLSRELKENGVGLDTQFETRTINPYKVKGGVKAGTTFKATAPELEDGLVLTVVAVPK